MEVQGLIMPAVEFAVNVSPILVIHYLIISNQYTQHLHDDNSSNFIVGMYLRCWGVVVAGT